MVESTVAGLAAGLVATRAVDAERVTFSCKRLEVRSGHRLVDIALIDVAVCADLFIGSRALWDPARIREIVLACAHPGSIGMSAVGSCLRPFGFQDAVGMHLELGGGGIRVLAPIAPGLVVPVEVRSYRLISLGDEVVLDPGLGTIALDGERSIEVDRHQRLTIRITDQGPRVVDIGRCLAEAARVGAFRSITAGLPA
jgi:hypothetical protein